LVPHEYSIINKTYELTTKVPVNDIADSRYGVYVPLVAERGMAAKKQPDELTFKLFDEGFVKECYDGVSFFSDKPPNGRRKDKSNTASTRSRSAKNIQRAEQA
jgi:phage major head subunit gpT-like protein